MKFQGRTDEYLQLVDISKENAHVLNDKISNSLAIVWSIAESNKVILDGVPLTLNNNQILFLTEFHHIEIEQLIALKFIRFNKAFYCIKDHDNEVGCNGLLFFANAHIPMISIAKAEQEKFDLLWRAFELEMTTVDNLQIEMLQMMLKRFIILCTRLYKEQNEKEPIPASDIDTIRDFNKLVEMHFRKIKTVAEYADLMHKSPKTLSNLFSKFNSDSPIQVIQNRILLEARRLLRYSDQSIKEIAYDLGFEDIQSFSRFFKRKETVSPKKYRAMLLSA